MLFLNVELLMFSIILQHSHFTKYLQAKGHSKLANSIKKLKVKYIEMDWQTMNNSDDCGIFVMRHMETYKGDQKNWDTRLKQESVRKLTYVSFSYIVSVFFNLNIM